MFANLENKIKRVGVLRGGEGKHYVSSLKKGSEIISHIFENLGDKYKVVDILIDKDHIWHINGLPVSPTDLIHKIDIAWNTSHSSFANIFSSLSIPTIGYGHFSSALENNRENLREHVKKIGINMPRAVVLPLYQEDFDGPQEKYAERKAKEIFNKFSSPWIVKSYTEDTNMAIHLAKTFPELVNSILDGVRHKKSILVEEFITGKIASLHTMPAFRGVNIYVFPFGSTFGDFSDAEKDKLISFAKTLHIHVDAKHYLKSDFILDKRGKVYLLNIEFSPDLNKDSQFSKACDFVGAKIHHVVDHILEKALS